MSFNIGDRVIITMSEEKLRNKKTDRVREGLGEKAFSKGKIYHIVTTPKEGCTFAIGNISFKQFEEYKIIEGGTLPLLDYIWVYAEEVRKVTEEDIINLSASLVDKVKGFNHGV